MSEISIDSASTVNRDQASLKTTHPHSIKQRSQYTLKLKKKKKRREPLQDRKQRSRNALIVVEVKRSPHHGAVLSLLKIYVVGLVWTRKHTYRVERNSLVP